MALGGARSADAAKLTALGGVVRLTTDAAVIEGCENLGPVESRPPYILPDDWQVQLRNAGGDLGADVVLYQKPMIIKAKGTAYRCAPVPPSEAGCAKDTDCKGDRVCDAGVCRTPG